MNEDAVLLFVEEFEDDEVTVLLGERRLNIPRALLPVDARQGSWLRLSVDHTHPDRGEDVEARRARRLQNDPGGDIEL